MQPILLFTTGVSGFIGFYLTKRLLQKKPDLRIIGIDNMNGYYNVFLKEWRLKEL